MTTPLPPVPAWIGIAFPELSDLQPLSVGGQKSVLSARHATHGHVVLKLMHSNADTERTQREILAVNQIGALRVPRIIDSGVVQSPAGPHLWFLEQRVQGETVRDLLATAPLHPHQVLRIGLHVLETLVAAEAARIVHRDIKPENLIVDAAGNCWVIDFGLARHLELTSLTATANQFGPMTWGYAPIEQCDNVKGEIDGRADLFALGVTLIESATGVHPFRSGARDVLEVRARIVAGVVPRLALAIVDQSQFADLVAVLTQRSRVHRPTTCSDAYVWMKEICDREGVK